MKEAKIRKFANYLFPLTLHLLQEIVQYTVKAETLMLG